MSFEQPHTASIVTAQTRSNPDDVKVEEIPLPPVEMWAALENSAPPPVAAATEGESRVETSAVLTDRIIERLTFTAPMWRDVPLKFPFNHVDLGHVSSIRVRRLTVGEVGDMLDRRDPKAPDMFDIYAAMTGIPAAVLRGLEACDGEEVTGVCFDFLPRLLRPVPRG